MTLPLDAWEDELGRMAAHRLRQRAKEQLAAGAWSGEELEDAIAAAERRLTRPQLETLWATLTSDRELSGLCAAGAGSPGD
ncbi:hypothetical protein [Miltoncostaea marina]|uniref:hypothetical protein n=1 Tax=Miltoncostaea marina TaxID=2843215 RepID=UPI001C3C331F|nr:hypothetical protein [Miltoncostaea marina]